ncbi:MAG: Gfo/Idh/MocA family oxidoreductase [Acholeplasmataceae bacterium]|nr:Gfo/Idh/MocA family oxidoreductase [Acholeplasmataceae bacterium]
MRITKKDEKITISVVGFGNRSKAYIDVLEKYYKDKYVINAIFEPNKERQQQLKTEFNIKNENIYNGYEDFIKLKRLSDVVIIGTLDDQHYIPVMHAIKEGYDIILEKPIAMTVEEIVDISELAKRQKNQLIAVCHVLRYSPLFTKIKELLDEKVIGNVINIQHNENVGYYHFAHSYVRGNWRNTDISAPFIVAKSCHDFDILLYLLNKHSIYLSSMGSLSFFKHENYNKKIMAPKCSDCSISETCPYSALKIYGTGKIRSVVFDDSSAEKLAEDLSKSNYGRCVFLSDNNVVDHQVSIIEFEDGITATFNLSAFTNKIHRSLKIMGEYGEIRATENGKIIEVTRFGEEPYLVKVDEVKGGHGGSDIRFMQNFMESYLHNKPFNSTLEMSIESHIMAFAAEESRLKNGKLIKISDYYKKYI